MIYRVNIVIVLVVVIIITKNRRIFAPQQNIKQHQVYVFVDECEQNDSIFKLGSLTDPDTGVYSFVLMVMLDDILLLNTVMVINGFNKLKTAVKMSAEMMFIVKWNME